MGEIARFLSGVLAVLLLAGCAGDPARARSSETVTTLTDVHARLLGAERQVAQTQERLDALQSAQGDVRPAFAAVRDQIPLLEREAERLAVERAFVRESGKAYTENWQSELKTIQNADLRDIGMRRVEEMSARLATIDQQYEQVLGVYTTYLSELRDLQTYLLNDLNYTAVQASQPWFDNARTIGQTLRESLYALAGEVGMTTNSLSPVPVPVAERRATAASQPAEQFIDPALQPGE